MKICIPLEGRVRTVIRSSFLAAKRTDATHYSLTGETFQMSGVTADQVILLPDDISIAEGEAVTDELLMQALPIESFIVVSAEEALPNALGLLLRLAVADGRLTDAELLSVKPALEGRLWQPGIEAKVGDVYAYAYTTGDVGSAVQTNTFTYGVSAWKDKLTAFNGVGISYDEIGNPLSDGTWTYTWQKGRQLQSMSKSGETVSFLYNEDGLRVQKAATSTGTTKYTLHGKNIMHMTVGSSTLHFFYDAQNKPAMVLFNGTAYAYLYNLQGDVIALVDANGSKVVEYKYDAWGRPLSKAGTLATTLGSLQPFRYRGYVFDEET